MKAEAIRKEKASRAALKELEIARNHAQKAQESYNSFKQTAEDNVNETYEKRPERKEPRTEENNNGNSKDFGSGLAIGAVTIALIASGVWALSKDPISGDLRIKTWFNGLNKNKTNTEDDTDVIVDEETMMERSGFVYDYENNVVIVPSQIDPNATYAYDYEANSENTTSFVDTNGNAIPVLTEAGQSLISPNNTNIPANGEYVVLTTERFEEFTANLIKKYEDLGLQLSREDITKYVMLRNIDKLRQDNSELIEQIVGTQNIFEVITDACHVLDATRDYNLLYFDKYHNTDGFLSAADGVFDEVQRAKALEFERRVYEIGSYYQDEEKYNELAYALMRDLDNPLTPIAEMEDGVSYGLMSVDMYMVRTTFGTDRYIKLNDTNADMIQYFVSFPEDDAKHSDNALMNGNISNVIRLLSECEAKTRTK